MMTNNILNRKHISLILLLSLFLIISRFQILASDSKLSASISYKGIDERGNIIDVPQVTITTNISYRTQPLLQYIFFDENSSNLHKRYFLINEKSTASFNEENLYNFNVLATYYNILNIVGKRMEKYPQAKLTITGCNSGQGNEKNNLELSKKRAETISDYFTKIWKIDKNRLSIKYTNLPEKASSSDVNPYMAYAENRRVELSSDDERILSQVVTIDTIRKSSPPTLRFYLNTVSDSGLSRWDFRAEKLHQYEDNRNRNIDLALLPEYIDWKLTSNFYIVPREGKNINVSLEVTDNSDNRNKFSTSTQIIPLMIFNDDKIKNKVVNNREIAEFSLILFQYNSSELLKEHFETINWIKEKNIIKPNSTIFIEGHTDVIGNSIYNKNLSENRASSVKNALETNNIIKSTNQVSFKGYGSEKLLYDNDFPEGRFYSRTVKIIIESKVSN